MKLYFIQKCDLILTRSLIARLTVDVQKTYPVVIVLTFERCITGLSYNVAWQYVSGWHRFGLDGKAKLLISTDPDVGVNPLDFLLMATEYLNVKYSVLYVLKHPALVSNEKSCCCCSRNSV